jgi:hypothetical protein
MVSVFGSVALTGVAAVASVAAVGGTLHLQVGDARTSADPAAAAAAAAPAAACTARILPDLGGRGGNVVAASSNGIYVGFADDTSGRSQPVIWRGASITPLHLSLESVTPTGVNRQGVVVGTGYDSAAQALVGWWWNAGKSGRLSVRAGDIAMPAAIDDAGHVVGALVADEEHADGPGADEDQRAAYWPQVGTPPQELPPLPGNSAAEAFAIAPDGTVGGVSLGSGGAPVVWRPGGAARRLQGLNGQLGIVRGFDTDSRPVGDALAGGTADHAVAWDAAGQPTDLGTLGGGRQSVATAASSGLVTGYAAVPATQGGTLTQPVLWEGGQALALPLDPTTGFSAVTGSANAAVTVGATVLVAGNTADLAGQRRPTEWRCVP